MNDTYIAVKSFIFISKVYVLSHEAVAYEPRPRNDDIWHRLLS